MVQGVRRKLHEIFHRTRVLLAVIVERELVILSTFLMGLKVGDISHLEPERIVILASQQCMCRSATLLK